MLVLQVYDKDDDENAGVDQPEGKLDSETVVPRHQPVDSAGRNLNEKDPESDSGAAVAAASAKPEIADHRHQIKCSEVLAAVIAMRTGPDDGTTTGKTVTAQIEETAYRKAEENKNYRYISVHQPISDERRQILECELQILKFSRSIATSKEIPAVLLTPTAIYV